MCWVFIFLGLLSGFKVLNRGVQMRISYEAGSPFLRFWFKWRCKYCVLGCSSFSSINLVERRWHRLFLQIFLWLFFLKSLELGFYPRLLKFVRFLQIILRCEICRFKMFTWSCIRDLRKFPIIFLHLWLSRAVTCLRLIVGNSLFNIVSDGWIHF
jgi:hypothetical protein